MHFKNKKLIIYLLIIIYIVIDFFLFNKISDNRNLILVEFSFILLSLLKLLFVLSLWIKTRFHRKINQFFKKNKFLNTQISPRILSVFRIIFGILLFSQAIQVYDYIDFISFDASLVEIEQLKTTWWIWTGCIVSVILGLPGRIFYVFSYFGISYYLDPTVGTNLFQIGFFWLIFMGTTNDPKLTISSKIPFLYKWNKHSPPSSLWPLFLLACNFILIITSAGISKLFDPFWFNGYGFYYTFMQPWIKEPMFNFLLDSQFLMKTMSYLTILSEIMVCVFLVKKYRWVGFSLMISMFFLLTFVIRIDPIGPVGLVICIGLSAIFFSDKNHLVEKKAKVNSYYYYLFIVSIIGFFKTIIVTNPFIGDRVGYPKISFPYSKISSIKEFNDKGNSDVYSKDSIRYLYQKAKTSYLWSFNLIDNLYPVLGGFYSPFNFKHFLARFYYRIDFYNPEGEQLVNKSNFNLFEFDGTMHKKAWYSRILEQRVLSNRMWKIQMIHRDLLYDKGINEKDILFAKALFNHFAIKQHINPKDIRAILKIKLIELPYSFKGNVMPWKKSPWIDFISFDNEKDSLSILETKSYQEYFNNINSFEALKNISPITYE